jgi:hypothetical protein
MAINITYNDQTKTIRLSELPKFSEATAMVLKKTDSVTQNTVLKNYNYDLTSTLKERAESIETVRSALTEIQEHKTREVIYACLKTAVACAIVAGIVLGAVFGPAEIAVVIALLVGIVGTGISSYITEQSCNKIVEFTRSDYWNVQPRGWRGLYNPIGLITALFMPLYEALTRQGRIERVQNKQTTAMKKDLNTFLQFAEALSNNLAEIRQQLEVSKTKKEEYISKIRPQIQDLALNEATEVTLLKLNAELNALQETQKVLNAFEAS